jgi:Tol biopolymer transport system component
MDATSSPQPPREGRLDSWKKIAAHFRRDVTTVQRWERREGMPVHRHRHDKQGSVYAFRTELDVWWQGRRATLAAEAAGEGTVSAGLAPAARVPRLRRLRLAAASVAVLLLGTGLYALAVRTELLWRNPLATARFVPLNDWPGTERAAVISRDGSRVAFLADRDGRIDAWVAQLGSGEYRNLTHGGGRELVNPSIRTLGFTPQGTHVTIWGRSADGSRPEDIQLLAAPVAGGPLDTYLAGAAEAAWSSDGRRIVFHTTAPGDPLFVRAQGETTGGQIYAAPAGVHCHFPLWAPDDAFIYFVRGVPPNAWDVWRLRPSGANLERVTFQNAAVSHPVLLDERTLLYLATDTQGDGPWLYATDVERRVAHRVSFGLEHYTSLSASADGTRLVVTVANTQASLWEVTLSGRGAAAAPPAERVASVATGRSPRVGTDELLYVAPQGHRPGIWRLAGGASRELWGGGARASIVGAPAFSPDHRQIAFSVAEGERTRLHVMDADGRGLQLVTDTLRLRGNLAWTPDGRSIVSAVLYDGEPRLTRIFLDRSAPLVLVAEYSLDPVWSPDGAFMLYSGADVGTTFPIRAVAADGRPYPTPSLILTRGARRVAFWPDGRQLVVLRGAVDHKDFALVDLKTGAEQPLAKLAADFVVGDFDLAPDGSRIVFERVEEHSKIALIERSR